MTVTEMDTKLKNDLSDPNGEVWTQSANRLPALNSAQRTFAALLISTGNRELLDELEEEEQPSVDSTGYALTSLTNRYFMRNGYVKAYILDDGGVKRWVTKLDSEDVGLTENSYMAGTTRSPKLYITSDLLYLLITTGGYPRTLYLTYIGMPHTLATSASGSGKTQQVATCELNPMYHDLIVMMAEVELRRQRGDASDFNQIQIISQYVSGQLAMLGRAKEPNAKEEAVGQFMRKQQDMEVSRGV